MGSSETPLSETCGRPRGWGGWVDGRVGCVDNWGGVGRGWMDGSAGGYGRVAAV